MELFCETTLGFGLCCAVEVGESGVDDDEGAMQYVKRRCSAKITNGFDAASATTTLSILSGEYLLLQGGTRDNFITTSIFSANPTCKHARVVRRRGEVLTLGQLLLAPHARRLRCLIRTRHAFAKGDCAEIFATDIGIRELEKHRLAHHHPQLIDYKRSDSDVPRHARIELAEGGRLEHAAASRGGVNNKSKTSSRGFSRTDDSPVAHTSSCGTARNCA